MDKLLKDLSKICVIPHMDIHVNSDFVRMKIGQFPKTLLHWKAEEVISLTQWVQKPSSTPDNIQLCLVIDLYQLIGMVERKHSEARSQRVRSLLSRT